MRFFLDSGFFSGVMGVLFHLLNLESVSGTSPIGSKSTAPGYSGVSPIG
jgi:hypothetical protein